MYLYNRYYEQNCNGHERIQQKKRVPLKKNKQRSEEEDCNEYSLECRVAWIGKLDTEKVRVRQIRNFTKLRFSKKSRN